MGGQLDVNIAKLKKLAQHYPDLLVSCQLCPRRCGRNRWWGEPGFCAAGKEVKIHSYCLHAGEEPPVSGRGGSGTIFFSYCHGRCVYCQNFKFSQLGSGTELSVARLAEIMLSLQERGAHNINLVTPTHYLPQIFAALYLAVSAGLRIPLIYNTNGYELPETLELLSAIIDIYLPDMRYSNDESADKYSALPDYVFYNREAVKLMYQQVGNLIVTDGIAKQGLIIRHLVLPQDIAGTEQTLDFIAKEISPETALSVMSQYYPAFRAYEYPELNRLLTAAEYEEALELVRRYKMPNAWCQGDLDDKDRQMFLGTNFTPLESHVQGRGSSEVNE